MNTVELRFEVFGESAGIVVDIAEVDKFVEDLRMETGHIEAVRIEAVRTAAVRTAAVCNHFDDCYSDWDIAENTWAFEILLTFLENELNNCISTSTNLNGVTKLASETFNQSINFYNYKRFSQIVFF